MSRVLNAHTTKWQHPVRSLLGACWELRHEMSKAKWLERKMHNAKDDGLFIQPLLVYVFAHIMWRRKAIAVQSGLKQASQRQQEPTERRYSQTQLQRRGTLLPAQPSKAIGSCRGSGSLQPQAASWTECHSEPLPKLRRENFLLYLAQKNLFLAQLCLLLTCPHISCETEN